MEETNVKSVSEEKDKEKSPSKDDQKDTSTQTVESKNPSKNSESPKEEEPKGEKDSEKDLEKEKEKEGEKEEDKNKDDSKDDSLKKKPKNWKKSRKKKNTKDDAYIGDIKNWPTLEEAAQPGQGGTNSPSTESSAASAGQTSPPQSHPQSQQSHGKSDEHKKAQKKKKGPNWVPFKEIIGAPSTRTSGSRGASGAGGGRRVKDGARGGATATGDRPYRQSNYRQSNRGRGRGSYNNYMNYSRQDAYPNNPSSSRPYSHGKPPADPEALREALIKQIEYYFSIENLCKDIWLRIQMDDQGWLPLSLISNFNRVKSLTTDVKLITEVLKDSTLVEIQDGKIRKRKDWATWTFPPKVNPSDPTSSSTPETPAAPTTTAATTATTTATTTTTAATTTATTTTVTTPSEVPAPATN